MKEAEILNAILHELGREPDLTLWRNNTGVYRSEIATRAHMLRLHRLICEGSTETALALIAALLKAEQRFVHFGLCVGSSDLIGIVRPNARILALEVKTETGQATREQLQFLELVNRSGGVGRIVRCVDDARKAFWDAKEMAA